MQFGEGLPHRDEDHERRVERVLATARLFIATSFAISLIVPPFAAVPSEQAAYGWWLAYAAYSAAVLLLLRFRQTMRRGAPVVLQAADLAWAAAAALAHRGPGGPFFALLIFVVLTAAYRWGLRGTLASSAASLIILTLDSQGLPFGQVGTTAAAVADRQGLLGRIASILFTALLGGYLAGEDRVLRQKLGAQARLVALARAEHGFSAALRAVTAELLQLFSAKRFLLAVHELQTGRLLLASIAPRHGDEAHPLLVELPADRKAWYFFESPAAWSAAWREPGRSRLLALDEEGRRIEGRFEVPAEFQAAHPCGTLMSVSFDADEEWAGRLFLLDPPRAEVREASLRFLQQLTAQVGPVVHSVYLYRRLRTRAGAIERSRVARELHDGVIQSLIGMEMRIDVLKRQSGASTDGSLEAELERLQKDVHEEVLNLRDLMQQMKPRDLSPAQLMDYLIDIVDRFRRDTGIAASFVSELREVPLGPHARRELARILQEALINVRKHSAARHVLVRLDRHDGLFRLVVDDDGRGFDFEGRLGDAELDAARRGPVVIKERAHAIGGEVTIASVPGRGSRLEVTIPAAHP